MWGSLGGSSHPPARPLSLHSPQTHHHSDVLGQVLRAAHEEVREGGLQGQRVSPGVCAQGNPGRGCRPQTHASIEHLVAEAAVEFLRVGLWL